MVEGRVSGSAEELLRSALEKIVFFECRVAGLENELESARNNAVRAREEAGAARRREAALETTAAQARGERAAAAAQNAELGERVRLLETERERFLSGMVERAHLAGAPAGEGEAAGSEDDLAGFISELRAEIEVLRSWKRAAEAAGVKVDEGASAPATPPAREATPAVPALATRFEAAGRIGVSREQARSLPTFTTRSERVLYEVSLDDLGATDPGARRRAADGLRVLGSRNAAPLVAAALGREEDAEVKAALLAALGALAEPSAADLALRELSDARPAVRAAALEAASALAKERAAPQLAAALGDHSPLVRRRAAVLLGFTAGDTAEDALVAALSDRDPGVARTAAVALSGRPSARAQGALARALEHPEPEVRRAAARAVGRWSGEAVDTSAPEPERRWAARRIAEKLLAVDGAELRRAVMRVPAAVSLTARGSSLRASGPEAQARAVPSSSDADGQPVSSPSHKGEGRGEARETSRPFAASAPLPTPVPAGGARDIAVAAAGAMLRAAVAVAASDPDPALGSAALAEVRASLRGSSADELAAVLARDRATVEASLRALVAQGRLVVRGPRFFMS
jgi:hypothetical protein